jgi:hypothetical protein
MPKCLKLILNLTIAVMILSEVQAKEPEYTWGMTMDAFRSANPAVEFIQFNPSTTADYTNKIMTYITGIDATTRDKMEILRLKSSPVRDYLFVDKKLFSVMDDHGETTVKNVKDLRESLSVRFGQNEVKKDYGLLVYSYSDKKTRVLLYAKTVDDNLVKCRIYYYPEKLFMMLLNL